jgi:hypothetical protein
LWVRNAIRRELGLIPLNVAERYRRKTQSLRGQSDRATDMVLQRRNTTVNMRKYQCKQKHKGNGSMANANQAELEQASIQDAVTFFDQVADEDLLRFLRSLPVIAMNDDDFFTIEDLTYEALLQPYVLQAWKTVSGNLAIPGRLKHLTDVYKTAEAALEQDTGRKRRMPRSEVYGRLRQPRAAIVGPVMPPLAGHQRRRHQTGPANTNECSPQGSHRVHGVPRP